MSVIFIIGGSGELGRALAGGLKDEHQVIIGGLTEEKTAAAAQEIGCDGLVCDVTNWDSLKFVIGVIKERYGQVDVLINAAGLYTAGKIEDIDPSEAKRVFEVNTVGPLLSAKAVVPIMKQQNSGLIININSVGGVTVKSERSVYYGSKWGLTGISRNLQHELAPHNIRVTDIYPGALEKTMLVEGESTTRQDNYVTHQDMVATVRFIIDRPYNTLITQLGIEDLHYR